MTMSPEAKKLKELVSITSNPERDDEPNNLAEVLQANPELMPGLNEYIAWRDQNLRDQSESNETAEYSHKMKENIPKNIGKRR